MHKTIKKVGTDIEKMNFNTAVAQMMIFGNAVEKAGKISKENYKKLLQLVSPIAPFVTEEIWSNLGEKETMHKSSWPEYEEEKCKDKNVNIAVQINGKLRDTFVAEADLEDERVVEMAKSSEGYKKWVAEATPKKVIVVKNKVVNIVV
jgi:leucyl-tRNA synthetase